MAKLGQKFGSYSDELKREVLTKYVDDYCSPTILSKDYNIPIKTIKMWINKMNKTSLDEVCTKKKRGFPKNNDTDYKERYLILKKFLAFHNAQLKRK